MYIVYSSWFKGSSGQTKGPLTSTSNCICSKLTTGLLLAGWFEVRVDLIYPSAPLQSFLHEGFKKEVLINPYIIPQIINQINLLEKGWCFKANPFIESFNMPAIYNHWSVQSLLSFVLGWKVTSKIAEVFLQEAKVGITLHLAKDPQIFHRTHHAEIDPFRMNALNKTWVDRITEWWNQPRKIPVHNSRTVVILLKKHTLSCFEDLWRLSLRDLGSATEVNEGKGLAVILRPKRSWTLLERNCGLWKGFVHIMVDVDRKDSYISWLMLKSDICMKAGANQNKIQLTFVTLPN